MTIKNILMDGDKSICAFFKKKKFTLTISVDLVGGGTVTGAGIYNTGTSVNVNAIPSTDYVFTGWSGDLSGSINPTTIIINANKSVTAHFVKKIQYNLTTSVDPVGSGTITGAGKYDAGVNVNVEAIPAIDYEFDHWNGATGKWSGLTGFTEWYDNINYYADIWLANGFTEGRDLRVYTNTAQVNASKAAIIAATAKGIKCIWGVSYGTTITSTNWVVFRAAVLNAAQWAQDNGVFEFQLGNELEPIVDGTTITVVQLIANLKALATDVQTIFTNGNVSYSCMNSNIGDWVIAGKGDLDILASNVYMEYGAHYAEPWKASIDALIGAFGVGGTYLSEFAPNASGLEDYSTDEAVQAAAITEMIDYIKASGMKRALFYCWQDYTGGLFGVVKADGTYRLLWNSLIS